MACGDRRPWPVPGRGRPRRPTAKREPGPQRMKVLRASPRRVVRRARGRGVRVVRCGRGIDRVPPVHRVVRCARRGVSPGNVRRNRAQATASRSTSPRAIARSRSSCASAATMACAVAPCGVAATADAGGRRLVGHHWPLKSGLRRSRNAAVPSRMSSVENIRPNCAVSYSRPSSMPHSPPTLTQSSTPRSASGADAAS